LLKETPRDLAAAMQAASALSQDSRRAGVLAGVGIAQAHADAVVLHAEDVEDGLDEGEAALDFGGDLVLGAEEVGVVLGEAADAGHAVEFAGLFPAIDGAELGEADGHVAVGVGRGAEDLGVVGAVHGLEHEALDELIVGQDAVGGDGGCFGALVDAVGEALRDALDAAHDLRRRSSRGESVEGFALDDGRELRVFVIGEVAAGFVEIEGADVRGEDFGVALLLQFGGDEGLEFLADDGPWGSRG
jgi:hypothetical protein